MTIMRKCKYCDEVGEKSIDIDIDNYVKIGNAYAHVSCYRVHLKTKKKMNEDLIDAEIEFLKNKAKKDLKDIADKEEFINYIKSYYNISLSKWQYTKIAKVNKGTYSLQMKEGISYCDLLEMWKNKKFLRKLEKIAYNKNLDPSNRFDYDLSIVVGEYDKYKKSKIKKNAEKTSIDDILNKNRLTKKSIQKISKQEDDNEGIDIFDMIE